jgi:1-acyl-sn-glycerol-3-phosphate acyltransferase
MVAYVLLLSHSSNGLKTIGDQPTSIQQIEDGLRRWEATIIDNFYLLGEYDQCVIIDAPDNFKAYRGLLEQEISATANTQILPAIDLPLFQKLAARNFHIEKPHKWQIKWWAKLARLAFRYQTTNQYVWRHCKPRQIAGTHHFKSIDGPCIVVANHTSMADGLLVQYALPQRIRFNIYSGAAADRWFVKRKDRKEMVFKPWYQSLALGSFPIQRGGGSKALEHSHWLLDQGANLLIFPEGTRSTSRSMARFKHGVAMLALEHEIPVVPCYLTGMNKVKPKGSSVMHDAAVTASFLPPLRFASGTSVPDATNAIYHALNDVHQKVHEEGPQAALRISGTL